MKRSFLFILTLFIALFSFFVYAECTDNDGDGYGAVGTDLSTCPASHQYYDCDDTNPNIYPWADVGACGMCDGIVGFVIPKPGYYCPPTICSPASACGVGQCGEGIFGVMPSEMTNICLLDGECSVNECQATCDPDEDADGYSTSCGDCDDNDPSVIPWGDVGDCGMCDPLVGFVIPKPGYYCPPTICSPASACGVGQCGSHVFGVMPSEMTNICLLDGMCSAFECQATCELDEDLDSYSISCGDCDDTNAQIYPWQTFDVCAMCDPFVGIIIPPLYPCPETICPESGCGAGNCGANILGNYPSTVPNYCLEPYVCSENTCTLTCEADTDADGYSASCGDCNDVDATIYIGAEELCDGKDNNCDGIVPTNEADADSDGVRVCADDCDDIDPAIYPGATEVCDGKDNDCNDLIDDVDGDNDGVNDCVDDKCLGSVPWFAQSLKPNHYDSSNWPASSANYGCTCEQVLYCKPGTDEGEVKFGCTEGTVNVWTQQIGWALECQQNGKVTMEGESKDLFENTDSDILLDLVDGDKDNDGIPNSEDSEAESKPVELGRTGKGSPDWWCTKNPKKC